MENYVTGWMRGIKELSGTSGSKGCHSIETEELANTVVASCASSSRARMLTPGQQASSQRMNRITSVVMQYCHCDYFS
jgi:formate-dependent nitrite reductase cytochrome c552 subunit